MIIKGNILGLVVDLTSLGYFVEISADRYVVHSVLASADVVQ